MKTKACSSSSWADTGPLPHMHQLSYLSRKPQKRHSWSRGVTVVWCCFLISLASCLAFFSCLHLPSLLACLVASILCSLFPSLLPVSFSYFSRHRNIEQLTFRCEKLCPKNCRGTQSPWWSMDVCAKNQRSKYFLQCCPTAGREFKKDNALHWSPKNL